MKIATFAAAAAAALLAAAPASALQTTFFGEDTTAYGDQLFDGDPAAARADFLSNLDGVSNEDFESFASGTASPTLSFTGSAGTITANIAGTGSVTSGSGAGRFATSGVNYFEASTTSFEISFASEVAAFGFNGIDIGDFGGQVTVTTETAGGVQTVYNVGNVVGSGGDPDGAVLFWGVIDTDNPFVKVIFGNTNTSDVFGFDDMVIGDVEQVQAPGSEVPLPAAGWLLLSGVAGLAGVRRFGRKA